MLTTLVSGATTEQMAVKASLSLLVPEDGRMPDITVVGNSQNYPHATPIREDHKQDPDGIDHTWDLNHTPIIH